MKNKTYFGLAIYEDNYVLESDIKQLPFYDFWKESAKGSTYKALKNDGGIYLTDWIVFSEQFIRYGTHRYQKVFDLLEDDAYNNYSLNELKQKEQELLELIKLKSSKVLMELNQADLDEVQKAIKQKNTNEATNNNDIKYLNNNCKVKLNKKWFDTPIFWSSEDGELMPIKTIITIAIMNSPIYTTIAMLYYIFGEKAILDTVNDNLCIYEDKTINRVYRTLELCKEL